MNPTQKVKPKNEPRLKIFGGGLWAGRRGIIWRVFDAGVLEPVSTGDIIDRAVRIYRRNLAPLILIASVPALLGYVASVSFWSGYLGLVSGAGSSFPARSLMMIGVGMVFYPIYYFVLLATAAGLSRAVGDHIMLGEPIAFRKFLATVRRRIGDLLLMGLLSIVIVIVLYIIFSVVAYGLAAAVVLLAWVSSSAKLPTWLAATVIVILAVAALAGGIIALLMALARFMFLPQVVMIEGLSAGAALGRAIKLGAKNWYRIGAVFLFTTLIQMSLLEAFLLPLGLALYFAGYIKEDFLLHPAGRVIYSSVESLVSLLTLPVWMICFTLLYFDSRIRKEGYDVELLAQQLQQGVQAEEFYWKPSRQDLMGYPVPAGPRLQTSPLGLAGIETDAHCQQCGWRIEPSPAGEPARFCYKCGSALLKGQ